MAERCSLASKAASLSALSALAGVLLAGPGPSRRTGWALMQPAVHAALALLRSAHSAPLEVRSAPPPNPPARPLPPRPPHSRRTRRKASARRKRRAACGGSVRGARGLGSRTLMLGGPLLRPVQRLESRADAELRAQPRGRPAPRGPLEARVVGGRSRRLGDPGSKISRNVAGSLRHAASNRSTREPFDTQRGMGQDGRPGERRERGDRGLAPPLGSTCLPAWPSVGRTGGRSAWCAWCGT